MAENIFIQYDSPEQIIRYALSAKVSPLEGKGQLSKWLGASVSFV